jgi:hypothetical protein
MRSMDFVNDSRSDNTVILSADEVSFVQWGSLGRTWAAKGKTAKGQNNVKKKRFKDVWSYRVF